MQVRYVGMFDAVLVPAAGLSIARGEVVDVPDEIGAGLLRQGATSGDASSPGTEWERVDGQSPARRERNSKGT